MMFVLDDPIRPFTKRIFSHRTAWARMQRCMLLDIDKPVTLGHGDLSTYANADELIWAHGMEFVSEYNMAGGYLSHHSDALRAVLAFGAEKITVLERPLVESMFINLQKRASKTEFNLTPGEWSELQSLPQRVPVLKHNEITPSPKRVVLGDSHSIARYRGGSMVLRNDGLTLHGLLKRGIGNMFDEAGYIYVDELVIQAGNIDLRHHLLRFDDPQKEVMILLNELALQLENLRQQGRVGSYEVTSPYPIEFEGRRIPKAGGWYKGSPFYGSWSDRNELRGFMSYAMELLFDNVHKWPDEWYECDPETYAHTYMERPQSVHLSPQFYEWDMERNVPNVYA